MTERPAPHFGRALGRRSRTWRGLSLLLLPLAACALEEQVDRTAPESLDETGDGSETSPSTLGQTDGNESVPAEGEADPSEAEGGSEASMAGNTSAETQPVAEGGAGGSAAEGVDPGAVQLPPESSEPSAAEGGAGGEEPAEEGTSGAMAGGAGGAEASEGIDVVEPPPPPPPPPPSNPVMDLSRWRLELPVNEGDDVRRVEWPELATFELAPFFRMSEDEDSILFRVNAGGATTVNSQFPRSELREMNGPNTARWFIARATHIMEIEQRIVAITEEKPHIVAGQIHDEDDDIVMIRFEDDDDDRLFVESDGDKLGTLDDDYELGQWFNVRIEASEGRVQVFYNGDLRVDESMSCVGSCYFKAGAYLQSNTDEDDASAYGEVEIRSLTITHQ